MSRITILTEVFGERRRQHKKWGVQDLPIINHEKAGLYKALADSYKDINDTHFLQGTPLFSCILLEEVYEALSEIDPARQREELVQVAAVAVQMIECIDRNRRKRESEN